MGNSAKVIDIGGVKIGGDNQVAIQSMCNTKTQDVDTTVNQILELERAGCEIIRVAVPDVDAANAIKDIKKRIHIPLVADIHFDYNLALISMDMGADKVRINPGNIGDIDRVKAVVQKAKGYKIPIRIGVNSGSLHADELSEYGVTAKGLFESAKRETKVFEELDFTDIVISIKASDVRMCLDAYRMYADWRSYPLHLGITEAGGVLNGSIKSAVGLSLMLNEGIGDTIRVSLTGDPVKEVYAAKQILMALGLRKSGAKVVSCPTCGRTNINLIELAGKVENLVKDIDKDIKIAVMGCAVNGPGEAREADIGIAGGNGEGLLFKRGEIIKKVPETELFNVLKEEIEKL